MSKSISAIEGIGPKTSETLQSAGIRTVEGLLKATCDKKGRSSLAKETGLSESVLLKFANMADLFRIKGVASQYAELLEGAGVDTVKELKHRNPATLTAKMEAVNAEKNLVRKTPPLGLVESWVEQAKELPPTITH